MEKKTVSDVIELIMDLDEMLEMSGFERDNSIDLTYRRGNYRACLTIYCPDNDEDEDE